MTDVFPYPDVLTDDTKETLRMLVGPTQKFFEVREVPFFPLNSTSDWKLEISPLVSGSKRRGQERLVGNGGTESVARIERFGSLRIASTNRIRRFGIDEHTIRSFGRNRWCSRFGSRNCVGSSSSKFRILFKSSHSSRRLLSFSRSVSKVSYCLEIRLKRRNTCQHSLPERISRPSI